MIFEAVVTSAVRGLKRGRTGFQPVMQTKGLRDDVLRRLETLSAYRHISRQGSGQNPVIFNFNRLTTGIGNLAVISRTVDAGNDYSNRSNKCSHLVAFTEDEMRRFASTTPAALIANNIASFSNTWPGDPEERDQPLILDTTQEASSKCKLWEKHFGDAAWAAFLAERAQKKQPTILIAQDCSPESCQLIFDLLRESTALLSADGRWATTFETTIIGNSDAIIQGTYKGSPESEISRHGVLSLTIGEPPSDIDLNALPLSEKARTGEAEFISNPQLLDTQTQAAPTRPTKTQKKPPPLLKQPSKPQTEQVSYGKRNFYVALTIAILLVFVVASTGLLFVGSKLLPVLFPNSEKRVCEYADFNHLKGGDEIPPTPTPYDWRRLRFVDTRQDAENWAPAITQLLETDGLKSDQLKNWLKYEPTKKKEVYDLVNRISNGSASFDDYRKAAFFKSVDDQLNKNILTSLAKQAFSTRDKKERIKKIKELTEWRNALDLFSKWRNSEKPDPTLIDAVLKSKAYQYLPTTDEEKWRKWQGVFRAKLKYNENLDSEKLLEELGRNFTEALKTLYKNQSIEVDQMKAVLMNLYDESDQFEDKMIARLYDHVKKTADQDNPPLSLSEARDYILEQDAAKKQMEEIAMQQQEQEAEKAAQAKKKQDALNNSWAELKKTWNDRTQISEPQKNGIVLAGNVDGIASLFKNEHVELHVFQPLNKPNYFHLRRSDNEYLWQISAGPQNTQSNIGMITIDKDDLIFKPNKDAEPDVLFFFKHVPMMFSLSKDKSKRTDCHSLHELSSSNDGILRATLADSNQYKGLAKLFSEGVLEHEFQWDDTNNELGNLIREKSTGFDYKIRLKSSNPDFVFLPHETGAISQLVKLSNDSLLDEENKKITSEFSIACKFDEFKNIVLLERFDVFNQKFGDLDPKDTELNDGDGRKFSAIARSLSKPFAAEVRNKVEDLLIQICANHTNTTANLLTGKNEKEASNFFWNGLREKKLARNYLETSLTNLKNLTNRSWESIIACLLVKTSSDYKAKKKEVESRQPDKSPDNGWFYGKAGDTKFVKAIACGHLNKIDIEKCGADLKDELVTQKAKKPKDQDATKINELKHKITKWFAAYLYVSLRPSFIIARIEDKKKETFFNSMTIDTVIEFKSPDTYSEKNPITVQKTICQLRAPDPAEEKASDTN